MPFSPWTKQKDLIDIIKLIENYKLRETVDPIQLTIKLLIPKHSLIIQRSEISEFINDYDKNSLSYVWDYRDKEVNELQISLFNYLLENPDLDEHSQYLGMVEIIETMTRSNLILDPDYRFKNVPKLSETWFCCAEPSPIQLNRIKTNNALI